jgi:hypothetical protein
MPLYFLSTDFFVTCKFDLARARNIYAASGLSIRPKTQLSKIEALKEIVRAWGLNPEEVLTRESLTRPYAATGYGEEEHVKTLSQALREMMRKELPNDKSA